MGVWQGNQVSIRYMTKQTALDIHKPSIINEINVVKFTF